ncbi:MAG: glycoside hydrolase [Planctomycetota bacterium]
MATPPRHIQPLRSASPSRRRLGLRTTVGILLLASAAAFFAEQRAMAETASRVSIAFRIDDPQQRIDGFGASGAWWASVVGQWDQGKLDTILSLLYAPEGAHLSIYRHNIQAGGGDEIVNAWRTTPTIETQPGRYDWSADPGSHRVLRAVRELGVEHMVFFANSPPPRLTISGMVSGGGEGGVNLRPGAERDFARYLVDVAEHWRTDLGLKTAVLSPCNEPNWKWPGDPEYRSQEGCHFEPDGVARLTAATLAEIQERGAPLTVEAGEFGEWWGGSGDYIAKTIELILEREKDSGALGAVAVHSYWHTTESRRVLREYVAERWPSVPVAMTEVTQMKWGRGRGMDAALELAMVMMEDLAVGHATSWSFWTAVSGHDYHDGLVYVYPDESPMPIEGWSRSGQPEPERVVLTSKRLWLLGHFSRFVRPGSHRVPLNISAIGDDGLRGVGFRPEQTDEGEGVTAVLVLANHTRQPKALELQTPDGYRVLGIEQWITDDARDCVAAPTSDGLVAPPRSLVTLVVQLDR